MPDGSTKQTAPAAPPPAKEPLLFLFELHHDPIFNHPLWIDRLVKLVQCGSHSIHGGRVISVHGFDDWAKENDAKGLPQIILPGGGVTISGCAEKLFGLIGPTKKLFMRGGAVVTLVTRDDGLLAAR